MNLTHIFAAGSGFRVLDTTERSQTGLLTLEPGEATDVDLNEPSRSYAKEQQEAGDSGESGESGESDPD